MGSAKRDPSAFGFRVASLVLSECGGQSSPSTVDQAACTLAGRLQPIREAARSRAGADLACQEQQLGAWRACNTPAKSPERQNIPLGGFMCWFKIPPNRGELNEERSAGHCGPARGLCARPCCRPG